MRASTLIAWTEIINSEVEYYRDFFSFAEGRDCTVLGESRWCCVWKVYECERIFASDVSSENFLLYFRKPMG